MGEQFSLVAVRLSQGSLFCRRTSKRWRHEYLEGDKKKLARTEFVSGTMLLL